MTVPKQSGATPTPPSGEQWSIRSGEDQITVVEVGGGIRSWTRGAREILAGYAQSESCTSGRGQHLLPWPNRIRDGSYAFADKAYQLPLTEVALRNASHGLVRWAPWRLVERAADSLIVGHRLFPQPGWDWHLESKVRYAVSSAGLHVAVAVTNIGHAEAPFGYGAHPYVAIGDAALSEIELRVPAATVMDVDERQLPVATRPVEGSAEDFRVFQRIGSRRLDTAYTDFEVDDGRWTVAVQESGGSSRGRVEVWGESAAFPWAQVFTGKAEPDQPGTRGIAVEPMTCPADAFNSGRSLLVLGPGRTWSGEWGVRVT